jgi:hypothetical protein
MCAAPLLVAVNAFHVNSMRFEYNMVNISTPRLVTEMANVIQCVIYVSRNIQMLNAEHKY